MDGREVHVHLASEKHERPTRQSRFADAPRNAAVQQQQQWISSAAIPSQVIQKKNANLSLTHFFFYLGASSQRRTRCPPSFSVSIFFSEPMR